MVMRASVLLFLLAISATRQCWSENLPNIHNDDEVSLEVEDSDVENLLEEEDSINEENESTANDNAERIENEDDDSEETDNLEDENLEVDEENDQEDYVSHLDDKETDDGTSSAEKLSKLGISESDFQQIVTEAEEEVKRDVPRIPIESSEASKRTTYQARHYRAKFDPESEKRSHQALIMERVVAKLAKRSRLSNHKAVTKLFGLQIKKVVTHTTKLAQLKKECWVRRNSPFRTLDGTCNNLKNPILGAANTPFRRVLPSDYDDGISEPRQSSNKKGPLPNPRELSIKIFQDMDKPSGRFTHMTMIWGQFIDHDLTLAAPQKIDCPTQGDKCTKEPNRGECFGIPVPENDPHFPNVGVKCLHLVRSAPACNSKWRPREQVNTLTSYIDGSQVYGVNEETLNEVREPGTPFLRVQKSPIRKSRRVPFRKLLPSAPEEDFCRSSCGKPCFLAGDERANENQGLASMHTLFVREHNRIAYILKSKFKWDNERVFEESRKIVGAQIQHITYNEFLPIILGQSIRSRFRLNLQKFDFFRGYHKNINPSIINSFATAAYRFGHSLVRNTFSRPGLSPIQTDTFYDPCPVFEGTASIFQGLSKDPGQNVDRFFSSALTQSLVIGPNITLDLPAINIQRGREHGLPSYNVFRKLCGLKQARRISDFKGEISKKNRDLLEKFYNSSDDVDLFAGGILEKSLKGGVLGPTFSCLVARQFRNLRRGDRYWYERQGPTGFFGHQLAEIRKVTLARLICDNTRVSKIRGRLHTNKRWWGSRREVKVMETSLGMISCKIPACMDLSKWKQENE